VNTSTGEVKFLHALVDGIPVFPHWGKFKKIILSAIVQNKTVATVLNHNKVQKKILFKS
jgi:hypothetical protein